MERWHNGTTPADTDGAVFRGASAALCRRDAHPDLCDAHPDLCVVVTGARSSCNIGLPRAGISEPAAEADENWKQFAPGALDRHNLES